MCSNQERLNRTHNSSGDDRRRRNQNIPQFQDYCNDNGNNIVASDCVGTFLYFT